MKNDCVSLGEDRECLCEANGWNYCFVEEDNDPEMWCSEYEGSD